MRPLGRTERKVVLAAEVYRRRTGEPPTWTELERAIGVESRWKLVLVVRGLREKGLVSFVDDEPRSLEVYPAAIRLALDARGRRP